jgi:hypothetical protein
MTDKEPEIIEDDEVINDPPEDEADADEPDGAEKAADEGEADEGGEDTGEAEEGADEAAEGEETAPQLVKWTDDAGKEWEIPEDITPYLMKNRDFTHKTSDLARERTSFEQQKADWEADRKRTEDDMKIDAELARLESIADQYNQVDWARLSQDDLYEAQRQQFERTQVREKIAELKSERDSRQQQRREEAQLATTKRIDEADKYGRENIPGWQQGKDAELLQFAKEVGYDDQSLKDQVSVPMLKLLHLAHIGKAAQKRVNEKPKPATKEVKPATQVKAKSNPTNRKSLDEMSMAEYAEYRNRQEARKAANA